MHYEFTKHTSNIPNKIKKNNTQLLSLSFPPPVSPPHHVIYSPSTTLHTGRITSTVQKSGWQHTYLCTSTNHGTVPHSLQIPLHSLASHRLQSPSTNWHIRHCSCTVGGLRVLGPRRLPFLIGVMDGNVMMESSDVVGCRLLFQCRSVGKVIVPK
jgi:hypothetical protein